MGTGEGVCVHGEPSALREELAVSLWAVLEEKELTAPTHQGSPYKEQLFSEEEGRGG